MTSRRALVEAERNVESGRGIEAESGPRFREKPTDLCVVKGRWNNSIGLGRSVGVALALSAIDEIAMSRLSGSPLYSSSSDVQTNAFRPSSQGVDDSIAADAGPTGDAASLPPGTNNMVNSTTIECPPVEYGSRIFSSQ
jgi:hypothetical protein